MTWVEPHRRSLTADFRTRSPDALTLSSGWPVRHLCAHWLSASVRNVWDQITTKKPGKKRFMRRWVDAAATRAG